MRDFITFLMGVAPGIAAGWMMRDFQIHIAEELRIRRTMREARAKVDREDAAI
jgi:hypothetical protein